MSIHHRRDEGELLVIKLYGGKMNRGGRCILALEECGVKYQICDISLEKGDHKKPEYLKLNPNSAVPTLVDGETVVWESMAINLYLAEKYGKHLMPEGAEKRAPIYQWTVWGIATLEPPLVTVFLNRVFLPEKERNAAAADAATVRATELLAILDHALEGKKFLAGDGFTIADINVGHVVAWANMLGLDMSKMPHVGRWFDAFRSRPSFQKLIG
jgi:glutathione S-transferase